jgi:pimeloyl-ACP methyl ester carboxylesterase
MTPTRLADERPPGQRRWSGLGRGAAAVALVLAVSAAANYALARRAERRHPPPGCFLTIDGVRLHYVERGPGDSENRPTIVLLHGVGAMTQEVMLSGLVEALATDHRVIVFDRPGFGYSERPRRQLWTPAMQATLLRDALDRLGVARAVIVGHSWGTLVALEMALRDADLTAGLVLLSGYYFPTFRPDVLLLSWPAVPVLGDVLCYTVSPWLGRLTKPLLYKKLFAPAPVTASFAAGFPSELCFRPWQIRAAAVEVALLIPAAAALACRYRELRLPVAIVAGPGDRIIDFERQSARLYRTVPRSTLRALHQAGHMITHTAPDRIAGLIRDMVGAAGGR